MEVSNYYKLLLSKKRNGVVFNFVLRVYFKLHLLLVFFYEHHNNNSVIALIKTVFAKSIQTIANYIKYFNWCLNDLLPPLVDDYYPLLNIICVYYATSNLNSKQNTLGIKSGVTKENAAATDIGIWPRFMESQYRHL